ncbi:hypothetical protein DTO271D3_3098 [Paecilomyces variotii]|nr:hypothetical protein DTO212C5_5327 [Paecilomyces variotii]KAJ9316591.1 hypothetical protein DTO271D3_3098 [Paecilomyces variotii]
MAALQLIQDTTTPVESRDRAPDRSVNTINTAAQSLCIIFMTIFWGLRVYARTHVFNGFNKEDMMCTGAYVLGVCYSVIALIMGHFGGGMHIEDVPKEHIIPFEKTVYVTMVMYGPMAFLTKTSLLLIMTRVFSPYKKTVIFIYIILGIMLAYYIPAVIVKIRICSPISYFWTKSGHGTCLDESAIILADAVVSVVSDLVILTLPLPLTLSLQMPFRKKMRVMAILGAGGLACASSIIRLIFIVDFASSPDGTYQFMRINMFGNAEISIGVICACLPALSALITTYSREYSSGKGTHTSGHEMSRMKNSRSDGTKGSKHRMSILDAGSDQDILITNAQGEPKIETSIQGDSERQTAQYNSMNGIGILRTVDVQTTVVTTKQ